MTSTHNYIPYNCDLMLMLIKHYLLISTPHQLKSFISTNQAHNTWMNFLQISQPGTDFNSLGTQQWAVHGQPTCPTSVSLFGTEFLTHFLSHKHQSIIYSINYHINTPIQSPTATDCLRMSKNYPQFGPMFWDRSTTHSRHFLISSMHFKCQFPEF